uniref:Uncharacterized protein n=1 Tax=Acrobeloides nanus TaxID=290746 RepID=A0A914E476_9BILA
METLGLIHRSRTCVNCQEPMRDMKQGRGKYWICEKNVDVVFVVMDVGYSVAQSVAVIAPLWLLYIDVEQSTCFRLYTMSANLPFTQTNGRRIRALSVFLDGYCISEFIITVIL